MLQTHSTGATVRDHILAVAAELFAKNGVTGVTLDNILSATDVSRTTLYRYFRSKDDLVAEYLRRLDVPSRQSLLDAAERNATNPRSALLGLFDALGRWFRKPSFCGCVFTNTSIALSASPGHPAHRAAIVHKDGLRAWVRAKIDELGFAEIEGHSVSEELSDALMLLVEGSIVTAIVRRDVDSAKNARRAAERLLDTYLLKA